MSLDEHGEQALVCPAALRAADLGQALAGHDRAAWPGASREHAHHDPRAERVAAEVVVAVAEPEVLDECEPVVGEDVRRIGGRIVRSRALPVAAQVRDDDAVPLLGECAGLAVFEHVLARADEAVQHDQRPAGPGLVPCQVRAVAGGETKSCHGETISDRIALDRRDSGPGRARWSGGYGAARSGAGLVLSRKITLPLTRVTDCSPVSGASAISIARRPISWRGSATVVRPGS